MKIVQINATCGAGSTGKICVAIAELLDKANVENYIFYSAGKSLDLHGIKFTSKWYVKWQALLSRIFGNYGFNTYFATVKMLKKLDEISPDIVHLHNLHGHNVNLPLLFRYFKKHPQIKLFWTFHDCWAFTGYCTHFTIEKCRTWIYGCRDCVQRRRFSWFFDNSDKLYRQKKELMQGLNMTVITPSEWLADLVHQSFLKACPVKVINNGIDLTVFKLTDSDFREKYRIPKDKFLLLGVAFDWGMPKGLDVFVELAAKLPKVYQIVLVGTNESVDRQLPDNILSIHRTHDQKELAEIYSAADLFVNPTREDNYPTVNMEAIACGTPVLTFRTGGSPEMLNEKCGRVVECDDVEALIKEIIEIKNTNCFDRRECAAQAARFDLNERFAEYINLYDIRAEEKE